MKPPVGIPSDGIRPLFRGRIDQKERGRVLVLRNYTGMRNSSCQLVNLTFQVADHCRPCLIGFVDEVILELQHAAADGTRSFTRSGSAPDQGRHAVGVRAALRDAEIFLS